MNERFVPLRLVGAREHRKPFGLVPLDVIEPALLFLDADLKVLHRVDRISTFHEDWFVHLLRGVAKLPPETRELDAARAALAAGKPDPDLFVLQGGDEARYYEGEIRSGRYLVTVNTSASRAGEARAILRRHGAYDRETSLAAAAGTPPMM